MTYYATLEGLYCNHSSRKQKEIIHVCQQKFLKRWKHPLATCHVWLLSTGNGVHGSGKVRTLVSLPEEPSSQPSVTPAIGNPTPVVLPLAQ